VLERLINDLHGEAGSVIATFDRLGKAIHKKHLDLDVLAKEPTAQDVQRAADFAANLPGQLRTLRDAIESAAAQVELLP
jgi:hypothetical protein